MPQVVGSAGQQRSGQFRAKRNLPGGVPDPAVDRFAEHSASGPVKQSLVRRGPVLVQVASEQVGQDRWDRDDSHRSLGGT